MPAFCSEGRKMNASPAACSVRRLKGVETKYRAAAVEAKPKDILIRGQLVHRHLLSHLGFWRPFHDAW